MRTDILTMILSSTGVFLGGFSGWFFSRKKNNAEVTGIDIQNAQQLISMYKDYATNVKKDMEELTLIINTMKTKCVQPNICQRPQ